MHARIKEDDTPILHDLLFKFVRNLCRLEGSYLIGASCADYFLPLLENQIQNLVGHGR